MNHDNAHCLDYTSECPTTCYRARLTKELQDNPSIARFVSWMHLYGTDYCKRGDNNGERNEQ